MIFPVLIHPGCGEAAGDLTSRALKTEVLDIRPSPLPTQAS
jgi:hypothetical protein